MENKIEAAVELVESNEWQEIEETLRRVEVPSVLSSSPEQVTFQQPPVSSCFDTSNSPSCSSLVSISLEAELQSRDEFAVRIQTAVSSRAQSCRLGSSSVMTSSPIVDSNILTLFTTHFPSARFDASRAVWLFPVSEHNRLKLLLQTLPHVRFTSLPDWVLRVFDNSSRSSSNNSPLKSLDHISSRLLKALLPFQREDMLFVEVVVCCLLTRWVLERPCKHWQRYSTGVMSGPFSLSYRRLFAYSGQIRCNNGFLTSPPQTLTSS